MSSQTNPKFLISNLYIHTHIYILLKGCCKHELSIQYKYSFQSFILQMQAVNLKPHNFLTWIGARFFVSLINKSITYFNYPKKRKKEEKCTLDSYLIPLNLPLHLQCSPRNQARLLLSQFRLFSCKVQCAIPVFIQFMKHTFMGGATLKGGGAMAPPKF